MFSKTRSNSWIIKVSRRNEEKIFVNNFIPLPPDDFYTKSKLQDVLCRPSQCFANAEIKKIWHNLPWFTPEKNGSTFATLQTITYNRFKDFDRRKATIWLHLHVELKERSVFLQGFWSWAFRKKICIFSWLQWRKNFTIGNSKLQPLTIKNLIFNF